MILIVFSLYTMADLLSLFFFLFFFFICLHVTARRRGLCGVCLVFPSRMEENILSSLSCLPFSRVVSLLLYFCAHFPRFFFLGIVTRQDAPGNVPSNVRLDTSPDTTSRTTTTNEKLLRTYRGKKKKKSGNVFFDR